MVPNGWSNTCIDDNITFSGGAQPPREVFKFEPEEGYIRLIQIRDYKSDKFITYVPKKLAKKFCTADDVMIGRYGPPIFQILRGIEGAYNVALIKAIPKSGVDKEFMYYFLKRDPLLRVIESFSQRTSGQTGIEMDVLKAYPMHLPPLPEQRKIAQVLSTWDRGIATTEKLIDASKQQKKALMQQLLTGKKRLVDPETGKAFEGAWEEVKLESHINLLSGHAFKSSEFEKDSDYKLLRGINITRGALRWGEEQTFSWTQLNGFEKYLLSVGDIVISMDGSLVGRNYALITENNHEPMLLVQRVARIRCKKTLNNNYLLQQIASDRFKAYVDAVKTVTAIPHISAKDIKHFIISMPPVKEQQKIASVLTAADKEIELLEAKLVHFKQEKKALMQQLLTGKRRVKVDEDIAA
ncbi:restriction endonuclease subunit S [Vibrio campbellii]|uniref:restriction endonuclease subunit S n=1 Tax=Vibrio campbellii TaxID=680 RepID=UPI00398966FE